MDANEREVLLKDEVHAIVSSAVDRLNGIVPTSHKTPS